MTDVKEIIEKARAMPVMSYSAMRLMEVLGDENHSLADVSKIVETDSALTVEVLRLVNSAAFNLRYQIDTVAKALPYTGEKVIASIALKTCAPRFFNRPLSGYESRKGEMWAHSLRTAIAGGELAARAKETISSGRAFTAGIVHDIGKPVLSMFMGGKAADMLHKIDEGTAKDFFEAEKVTFGTDHCDVGGELARHWKLPEHLQAVIQHHHKPGDAPDVHRCLVYLIHLADMISMMGGSGTGADTMAYQLDERYRDYIDLDRNGLDSLMIAVAVEFEKMQSDVFGESEAEE
ncbi:MAG: HDOD domain-containing protein [Thermodesulfobacteriota bacterium]|nr:HDOD domain-containing protein [Thermodesulfobacteriota bacterium]